MRIFTHNVEVMLSSGNMYLLIRISIYVGVFLPLIMDEYDQINKPIMTTVFNPLTTRLWRINHV